MSRRGTPLLPPNRPPALPLRSALPVRSASLPARVAAALAGATLALLMASAAPALAAPSGGPTVTASPDTGLSATQAEVTVKGSGFDPSGELWVAVCQDDGVAPASFAHCLGGAIPNANASSSWAVVTADGRPRYAGPVPAAFTASGAFSVTLQIPVAAGQDADCITGSCAVYTRSANPADRTQDASTPVRFSPPPAVPTRVSDVPTTQVIGAAPTTLAPQSVLAESVAPGDDQSVMFAGFQPGETVDVTLFSDPVSLPSVVADSAGGVTITFTVPPDLPAGTHLVQAVGRSSGRVGVAEFTVDGAAASATGSTDATDGSAATDATPTTDTAAVGPAVPTADDSDAASMTAPSLPVSDTGSSADTALSEGAAGPSAEDTTVAADAGAESGRRAVWPWILLAAIVVVVGGIAAVLVYRRRAASHLAPAAGPAAAPAAGPAAAPAAGSEPSADGEAAPGSDGFGSAGASWADVGREGRPDGPAWRTDGIAAAPVWPLFTAGDQQPLAGTGYGEPYTPATSGSSAFAAPAGGPESGGPESGSADRQAGGGPATEQWRPHFDDAPGSPDADDAPGGAPDNSAPTTDALGDGPDATAPHREGGPGRPEPGGRHQAP